MDVAKFTASEMGEVSRFKGVHPRSGIEYDHFAFKAANLRSSYDLAPSTYKVTAEAAGQLGALGQSLKALPNPKILIRPSIIREAQSTSALEGTYAPLLDIFQGEIDDGTNVSTDIKEILNYVRAAESGLESILIKPISIPMLSSLQSLIVDGTPGGRIDQGKVRSVPVIIGTPDQPIESSRFIPMPPGTELEAAYGEWEKWIHADVELPLVAQIALAHYQFETLHPYADGNGRIGRLIISLQLVASGTLSVPVLNLSEWFNLDKSLYKDQLLELSQSGDLNK